MIFIGLGSSIGDAKQHFAQAQSGMEEHGIKVLKKSANLVNPPQGGVAQNQFNNAVWQIEFPETLWEKINWALLPSYRRQKLKAYKLLNTLQKVETQAQRRREIKWEDRTLDLDLLMFNHLKLENQRLLLPHPLIPERSFVLLPWQEIVDKNFEIPKFGAIDTLIQRLNNKSK